MWERGQVLTWQVKPEMPQGSSRPHARRALPGQVKVADDQVLSILRLGELQQQRQALLPDGRDPGGQEGGQEPARVRAQHKQALVLLCKTQGTSASCRPRRSHGLCPPSSKRETQFFSRRQDNEGKSMDSRSRLLGLNDQEMPLAELSASSLVEQGRGPM